MKQECPLAFVVLAWLAYAGATAFLVLSDQAGIALVWVVAAPALMWAYVHWFSSISRYLGYGSVADSAVLSPVRSPVEVTLYTALGCPFCPIVRHRLRALRPAIGFRLREVNVTARPEILVRKGVWSVPVVEVGGRRLVGNATTDQLTVLIAGAEAWTRFPTA